jgi:hypothetical protein
MVAGGARVLWAGAHGGGEGRPERCSGMVWGVPSERGGGGCWGTQSVALGWYAVSRWDTGWREARRGSGRGRREVVEPGRLGCVSGWGDLGSRMDVNGRY